MNLPKSFTKVLEKYQIKKDDLVFAAIGDLDDGVHGVGVLIVGADKDPTDSGKISLCPETGVSFRRI